MFKERRRSAGDRVYGPELPFLTITAIQFNLFKCLKTKTKKLFCSFLIALERISGEGVREHRIYSPTTGLSSSTCQWRGSFGQVTIPPASSVSSSVKWGQSYYLPRRIRMGNAGAHHKHYVPAGCRTGSEHTGAQSHLTGFIWWGFKALVSFGHPHLQMQFWL